jgi:hypothetical protein
MQNNTILFTWVLFALSAFVQRTNAQEPPAPVPLKERDDAWRKHELQRAEKLLDQHNFSAIDEAFAAKDLLLLWCYYVGSDELPIHLYRKATRQSLATTRPERVERVKLLIEKTEHASRYLRQIPGHARLLGDMIEETLYRRAGGGWMRRTYFECLWRLGQDGSDECIVEIGRYLFDQRNPGFRPYDPAKPKVSIYDTRGVPNTVQSDAIGSMLAVIRPRFKACESCVDAEGLLLKGFEEKVQNWWLTSEQAAPYRRSLAATGVVLPPGYPPMKELEGTKTTIAPPLKNPPYPDGESAPVETPPPGAVPQPTSPK